MRKALSVVLLAAALTTTACGGGKGNSAAATSSASSRTATSSGAATASQRTTATSNAANSTAFCSTYAPLVNELQLLGAIDLSNIVDLTDLQAAYSKFANETSNSTLESDLNRALAILNPVVNAGGSGSQAQSTRLTNLISKLGPELDSEAKADSCGSSPGG